MDPKESIVNLDEEVGDTPIISHNSSQQNLLLVSGALEQSSGFGFSGTESGLSSPPDSAIQITSLDHQRKSSDNLIQDVIEQLETQCSLRLDANPTSIILTPAYQQTTGVQESYSITPNETAFGSVSVIPTRPNASTFVEPKSSDFKTAEFYPEEAIKLAGEERRLFAWIPSAKTKEALNKIPNADKRLCYTMPGVMVEESMGDPVRDLLKKHVGELEAVKRASKTSNIPENLDGLRILIADGNFRSAIDMTGKLLKNLGQGFGAAHKHSRNCEESLKLWSVRLQLLVLIGQHNLAASESEPFGNLDSPDLYFEYYPEVYRGRKGILVPFEMRLLHAELPRLTGQPAESLTRVNRVAEVVKMILSNLNQGLSEDGTGTYANELERSLSLKLWNDRLVKTYKVLARCLLAVKEYRLVLDICEKVASASEHEKSSIFDSMGRLCLQLGDFQRATNYFQKFNSTASGDHRTKVATFMHAAFCFIFNNNYTEALQSFQKALEFDPADVSAANNAAVCMLYLGRLHDAVIMLEKLIQTFPKSALQETVCTNLCTLYELASARSVQKKVALLNLVNEYHGDGFNPSCLKLTA